MLPKASRRKGRLRHLAIGVAVSALSGSGPAAAGPAADPDKAIDALKTVGPIKHRIVHYRRESQLRSRRQHLPAEAWADQTSCGRPIMVPPQQS
jgi:hypothetical protein